MVAARKDVELADFVRFLSLNSEEAAQFFNFVDHALLICDSSRAEPRERYGYSDDFGLLAEHAEAKSGRSAEIFSSGIEGNIRRRCSHKKASSSSSC